MRRRKAKDRLAGRHLATPKMYTFINLSPAILSLSLSIGPTLSRLINIFVSFFVSPLVFRLFFNKFDTKFKLRLCRNRPRTAQNEKKKCSQLFIPILAGRLCGTFETGQYIDILLHVVCCVFFFCCFFPHPRKYRYAAGLEDRSRGQAQMVHPTRTATETQET